MSGSPLSTPENRDEFAGIDAALRVIGLRWQDLKSAQEIVLFGSRAAGVSTRDSDFDVLCIGRRVCTTRLTKPIDLLWLPSRRLTDARWLGSELAGHIAAYGRWMHGEPKWRESVVSSQRAVCRKTKMLENHVRALNRSWTFFPERYRRLHARLLRQDMQRLHRLASGNPVPPTPILDQEWREVAKSQHEFGEYLAAVVNSSLRTAIRDYVLMSDELFHAR